MAATRDAATLGAVSFSSPSSAAQRMVSTGPTHWNTDAICALVSTTP